MNQQIETCTCLNIGSIKFCMINLIHVIVGVPCGIQVSCYSGTKTIYVVRRACQRNGVLNSCVQAVVCLELRLLSVQLANAVTTARSTVAVMNHAIHHVAELV
jgi:hypothetical protein